MNTRSRKIMFLRSRGWCIELTTLLPSVSRLSRYGILNISQPYRPPRPFTGIALHLPSPKPLLKMLVREDAYFDVVIDIFKMKPKTTRRCIQNGPRDCWLSLQFFKNETWKYRLYSNLQYIRILWIYSLMWVHNEEGTIKDTDKSCLMKWI
jgi:hypothetical protein